MVISALCCCSLALLAWPERRSAAGRLAALGTSQKKKGIERAGPRFGSRRLLIIGLLPVVVLLGPVGGVSAALLIAAGWQQRRMRQRTKAEIAGSTAMAEALRTAVAELRSGTPPAVAAETAAADAPADVAAAMRALAGSARFGGEAGTTTTTTVSRSGSRLPEQLAVAWSLSRRHGLPLADLLDAVRRDVAAAGRFAARADASMSGPRASAAVLAALPGVGLLLGEAMGARPAHVLIGTSAGQALLGLGSALILAGVLWSAKLTRPSALR
jgi:tight adherence protein B